MDWSMFQRSSRCRAARGGRVTYRLHGSSHTDGMHVNPPPPSDRPRTKAGQREATTAALISAARELFAERGYADVGTEEIVARAGVTRGALYHHFKGGKEELFHAVVVEINAETVRHVSEVARAQTDPWDQLA